MPEFAVLFVMKAKNAMKTSVCADFLLAIIVNYGNNKKSIPVRTGSLKYFKTVIEFYCVI